MPSSPSSSSSSESQSRYKSRLFNLINRQYIQINGELRKKGRQLKLNIELGAKVLLYPIYLVAQTGRIARYKLQSFVKGKKLKFNFSKNQQEQSLPDVDEPIINLLERVKTEYISLSPQQNLQSIASNIDTNHLVLINFNNQVFQEISGEKSKQICLLIRDLRGDYWDKKRAINAQSQPTISTISEIDNYGDQEIVVFKFFWQLIAWIQKSNLTIYLDLFGESSYISPSELNSNFKNKETEKDNDKEKLTDSNVLLIKIDNKLANFEEGYLVYSQDSANKKLGKISNNISNNLDNNEKQSFSLRLLIKFAIDYFFGSYKVVIKDRNENAQLETIHKDNIVLENNQNSKELLPAKSNEKNDLLPQKIKVYLGGLNVQLKRILDKILPHRNKIVLLKNKDQVVIPSLENIQQNNSLNNSNENLDLTSKFSQRENPFKLQALILAVIEYYSKNKKKQVSLNPMETNKEISLNKLVSSKEIIIEENWLSWDDLYGNDINENNSEIVLANNPNNQEEEKSNQNQVLNQDDAKNKDVNLDIKSLNKKRRKRKQKDNRKRKIILPSHSNQNLLRNNTQAKNTLENENNQKNENLNPKNSDDNLQNVSQESYHSIDKNELENEQKFLSEEEEWLETKAVNLGYEKHFLQTILEWIDNAILWIEELVIKVVNFIKKNK